MRKIYIIPIILCTLFLGISGCNNKQETVVGWNTDHTAYTNECNATLMEGEYYEAMNDSFEANEAYFHMIKVIYNISLLNHV